MKQYINAQWEKVLQALSSLRVDVSSEAVHDFRVTLKKLRAALIAVDNSAVLKDLRLIYGDCGRVRSAEIYSTTLAAVAAETAIDISPACEMLAKYRTIAARRLQRGIIRVTNEDLLAIATQIDALVQNINEQRATHMVYKRVRKLREHIRDLESEIPDKGTLHAIRRYAKEISYLVSSDTSHSTESLRQHALAHHLESFLGAVHDEQELAEWLAKQGRCVIAKEHRKRLRSILKTRNRQNIALARVILRTFHEQW